MIRKQRGEQRLFRRMVDVRVDDTIVLAAPLTHFMRAIVHWEDDRAVARLTGPQGSGLLTSMARANALLVIPPERQQIEPGELARAILLGDDAATSDRFYV
jgi:molybdopterin molybdotransferase